MLCPNCGAKVPNRTASCPKCGRRLSAPPVQPSRGRHAAPAGGSGKKPILIIVLVLLLLAALATAVILLGKSDKDSGKSPDTPNDTVNDETNDRLPETDTSDSIDHTDDSNAIDDNKVTDDNQSADTQNGDDQRPDDDKITDTSGPAPTPEPDPEPITPELAEAQAAYADVVQELAAKYESWEAANDKTIEYDLIHLTDRDIPELLVGATGYFISVYMWSNGKALPVIEYWPYGTGGNAGYEYLPGQNIIRNFDSDLAGGIIHETYYTIDGDYGIIPVWPEDLSGWRFRDLNGNYMIDEDEPLLNEWIFYYGDTEITAEEYTKYQFPGDYQWLVGGVSAEEMLERLGAQSG